MGVAVAQELLQEAVVWAGLVRGLSVRVLAARQPKQQQGAGCLLWPLARLRGAVEPCWWALLGCSGRPNRRRLAPVAPSALLAVRQQLQSLQL